MHRVTGAPPGYGQAVVPAKVHVPSVPPSNTAPTQRAGRSQAGPVTVLHGASSFALATHRSVVPPSAPLTHVESFAQTLFAPLGWLPHGCPASTSVTGWHVLKFALVFRLTQ